VPCKWIVPTPFGETKMFSVKLFALPFTYTPAIWRSTEAKFLTEFEIMKYDKLQTPNI